MSEPSQEAKQAANWAGWHEAQTPEHHRAYCEGYDAATAKAREELIATQNEVIRLNGLLRVANTEKRDAQLAHQQPRAPLTHALDEANKRNRELVAARAPLVEELHVMHKGFSALQDVVLGMISRVKEGETTTQKGDKQESDIIR